MNSVGIDISKGRSTIAVMRPFGEVVVSPFEVRHTDSELSELASQLKILDGETRVLMEATGNYHIFALRRRACCNSHSLLLPWNSPLSHRAAWLPAICAAYAPNTRIL